MLPLCDPRHVPVSVASLGLAVSGTLCTGNTTIFEVGPSSQRKALEIHADHVRQSQVLFISK